MRCIGETVAGLNPFENLEEALEHFKLLRKEYRTKYSNLEKFGIPNPRSKLLDLYHEIIDLGQRLEANGVDICMYDEEE